MERWDIKLMSFTHQDVVNHNRRFPVAGQSKRTLLGTIMEAALPSAPAAPAKRIRQSDKPLMNKLETEWARHLICCYPLVKHHHQAVRFCIGNGAWFKPDICVTIEGQLTCYECKGPKEGKNVARGILALKTAAHAFPDIVFILVWKEDGGWKQQRILP